MASTRHPRSRTGCWICRLRKKKCDETRPVCQQCRNLKIQCDGYGVAQPAWMRDPTAATKKKEEIKLQIGKRGRRRRKALARIAEDFESGAMVDKVKDEPAQDDKTSLEDGSAAVEVAIKVDGGEETTWEKSNEQQFTFETIESGIQLLKPFQEAPVRYPTGAAEMLDSPRPPIGCYRCPIKNSFARGTSPASGYGILDAHTGKSLLKNARCRAILVHPPPPLWKPNNTTYPSTRTKEEENCHDEYDAIVALFMSSATTKHRVQPSPAELSDPSLVPPIHLTNPHEVKLVTHYIKNVFRLMYSGMSETRVQELLRDVIIPFMTLNPALFKGCMSDSAMHLAVTERRSESRVKALFADAWEHRVNCVQDLKRRLRDEGASEQNLATILSLASFEISSSLPNWQPHLQAAIECLVQLDLLNVPTHSVSSKFLMSRVIWMDILSALTLGRAPQLWANYREILSRPVHERAYCGLLDIMGCDDTVMFLVSEVMCVEDYKYRTLEDGMISWTRGSRRAIELDILLRDRDLPVAVKLPPSPEPPFQPLLQLGDGCSTDEHDPTGLLSSSPSSFSSLSTMSTASTMSSPQSLEASFNDESTATPPDSSRPSSPKFCTPLSPQTARENTTLTHFEEHPVFNTTLSDDHPLPPELPTDQGMIVKATTAAFRTATRIHLWSIGLGFYPRLSFFQQLLEELIVMVALIPIKLSRVVAWPLLVGGCMATEQKDRAFFAERCADQCGGSLDSIARVMREVWRRRDETDRVLGVGCGQEVHWRSVMREEGLEILLL